MNASVRRETPIPALNWASQCRDAVRLQSAVLKPRCVWEANYKLHKAMRVDGGGVG